MEKVLKNYSSHLQLKLTNYDQSCKKSISYKILLPKSYLTLSLGYRHVIFKPLQKHAYSNKLKISPPKIEYFQIKIQIFFFKFLLKT